jgi:hypothetical protein
MDMPMPKRTATPRRKRDFNRGYTTLPPELLTPDLFPRLDARHMVILTFLASYGLDAWPKIDSLVQATGFSRSKVRRALAELAYIGVLTTRHRSDGRGRQTSNLYQLGDGAPDGGFCDPRRLGHIKTCLAHDKLWTTLNQLFGSGKKEDADPKLVEGFRWCDKRAKKPAEVASETAEDGVAIQAEVTTELDCVSAPAEPTQERPCVLVSEVELDPAYATTTPFGEMKARVDGNSVFSRAFGRLHLTDPGKVNQMTAFCSEREMQHASIEIIARAHKLGFTLFDLEREYEYAEAKTTSKPQRLFLTRLRKGYRVNDKKDGFDPKNPTHTYAKTELETWLEQAGLEKQFKQARVNQLTPWMIAVVSAGLEPEIILEDFCDEFRVSAELAPPGVICAKLRDHFDEFAKSMRVKSPDGGIGTLEDYLPNAKPESHKARIEELADDEEDEEPQCPLAGPEDGVLRAVSSSVPLPASEPEKGHNAVASARLRELQAKYLAEIGKTQAEVDAERAALDAEAEEKSVA